jgi:nucleotide-binding universal stress UspA family protein
MPSLVLVPFDGGPVAQAAFRGVCLEAGAHGDTMVAALYVALIPRQVPLRADLPWLAREVTRVQLLAEPIVAETGANAWAEWVCARELAPAVAGVAAELQASRIVVGMAPTRRRPAWLRRWSWPERLRRLAPCPVAVRVVEPTGVTAARVSSGALS